MQLDSRLSPSKNGIGRLFLAIPNWLDCSAKGKLGMMSPSCTSVRWERNLGSSAPRLVNLLPCNARAIIPSDRPRNDAAFEFLARGKGPSIILCCSSCHLNSSSSTDLFFKIFNLESLSIASQLPFPCLRTPIHKASSSSSDHASNFNLFFVNLCASVWVLIVVLSRTVVWFSAIGCPVCPKPRFNIGANSGITCFCLSFSLRSCPKLGPKCADHMSLPESFPSFIFGLSDRFGKKSVCSFLELLDGIGNFRGDTSSEAKLGRPSFSLNEEKELPKLSLGSDKNFPEVGGRGCTWRNTTYHT